MSGKYFDEYNTDATEERLSLYVKEMDEFIESYGYEREIASVKNNSSIQDIESEILSFLKENSKGLNHLEIYGTLKEYGERTIYVCCYEPYGDELFCVERKEQKLYFFKKPEYKYGIRMEHINYFACNI